MIMMDFGSYCQLLNCLRIYGQEDGILPHEESLGILVTESANILPGLGRSLLNLIFIQLRDFRSASTMTANFQSVLIGPSAE